MMLLSGSEHWSLSLPYPGKEGGKERVWGRGTGRVTAVCTTIKEEITLSNFHVHILVQPNLGGNILAEHLQLNGFQ